MNILIRLANAIRFAIEEKNKKLEEIRVLLQRIHDNCVADNEDNQPQLDALTEQLKKSTDAQKAAIDAANQSTPNPQRKGTHHGTT